MKKFKFVSLFAVILCCVVAFSGCTFSFFANPTVSSNSEKLSTYSSQQFYQNTTIEKQDNATESAIAQAYIDISFTVCIYKVTETTQSGKTQTSETLSTYGSGFIVHKGGFILTNHHVISDALQEAKTTENGNGMNLVSTKTYYKVYVSQDGGKTKYSAKILWQNSSCDMAILICQDFATLPAASLKDRTVYCDESEKIGLLEKVITVGNQKSYYASATTGTISSTNLRIATSGTNVYEHLIQHNASINHGNSGGALIDMNGDVIGLNTLGDDDANSLFFAVSIYPAIAVLDKVVDNFYSSNSETTELTLGVTGRDMDNDALSSNPLGVNKQGLYVTQVSEGCIINGIQAEDYIVGIEIVTQEGTKSFDVWDSNSLLYARINLLYAQSATVEVNRGGTIVTLTMEL